MNDQKKSFLKKAVGVAAGVVAPGIKNLTSLGKTAINNYPKIKSTLSSIKNKVGEKVENTKTGITKGIVKSLGNTPAGDTLREGLRKQGRKI